MIKRRKTVELRATLKDAQIVEVSPDGSKARINIPGAGLREIHQSGVHDDSEVWWKTSSGKHKGEFGPGKLILHGWYASRVQIGVDNG